jgi:hypothetical protein
VATLSGEQPRQTDGLSLRVRLGRRE